jgi:hypothetical protein
MSCSSTTCTSITYDTPASKAFAGFEWFWQRPSAWPTKINDGCGRSHQRRQLPGLDNRRLADVGLSREDTLEEACKSFWFGITMWRL